MNKNERNGGKRNRSAATSSKEMRRSKPDNNRRAQTGELWGAAIQSITNTGLLHFARNDGYIQHIKACVSTGLKN